MIAENGVEDSLQDLLLPLLLLVVVIIIAGGIELIRMQRKLKKSIVMVRLDIIQMFTLAGRCKGLVVWRQECETMNSQ